MDHSPIIGEALNMRQRNHITQEHTIELNNDNQILQLWIQENFTGYSKGPFIVQCTKISIHLMCS